MDLSQYHSYYGGQPWKVTDRGVVVGDAVLRTPGEPVTVRRVLLKYGDMAAVASGEHGVPVACILACLATESGGREGARREEPGYISDEATPHRVSIGVMQTLVSTARQVMGSKVPGVWLDDPEHSIQAGVRYMARQASVTHYDPPLVAAAYNAGGIYEDPFVPNPWRLRCYPLGTGRHITKFVRYYGDACVVMGER